MAKNKIIKLRLHMGVAGTVIAIILLLLIWFVWAKFGVKIASQFLQDEKPSNAGSWGDSFGALNALVSSFGFSGVLVTLLLQRESMRRQQEESKLQAEDQHRQQFDRAFFELLGLMRAVRSEIFFKYSGEYIAASGRKAQNTAHGPEALSRAAREASYWLNAAKKDGVLDGKKISRIYSIRIHNRAETRFGPYYRVIYTILRRISEDKILSREEKDRYGNLLRSQLQSREVILLALNGLTPMSNDFSNFLNEFRIMKYIPSEDMKKILLQAGYKPEAFEARD